MLPTTERDDEQNGQESPTKRSAFTPGPWAVHRHNAYVVPAAHLSRPIGGSTNAVEDLNDYAQEICAMHWPDPHRSETEVRANTKLVAAAPELYAIVRRVAEYFADTDAPLGIDARKALAKVA